MSDKKDIRWVQRLENYTKAVKQITKFIEKGELNELEEQGLIQSFEYTYELAWNTLKDLFEQQGESDILGSRDAFRLAFKRGLIEDGEIWMDMIKKRGLTSHTYNEKVAEEITTHIRDKYFGEFVRLQSKLETLSKKP
ncbi:MAG: nucleotidyltransferase substrate binding protein [Candidatus Acidiferrales bacterium]